MYNITHGPRATHRRSQKDPRSRATGCPSDARTRGTGEARRYRVVGSVAEVRGRVGLVDFLLPPHVRTTRTASHQKGARNLRSGLRGVRTQAPPPQTASTMTRGPRHRDLRMRQTVTHVPGLFRYRCRRPHQGSVDTFFLTSRGHPGLRPDGVLDCLFPTARTYVTASMRRCT